MSFTSVFDDADGDGNRISDAFDVSVTAPPPQQAGPPAGPPQVSNLRCVADTDRVVFLWNAPEWSGGNTYAYDYQLTLPTAGVGAAGSYAARCCGDTATIRPAERPA